MKFDEIANFNSNFRTYDPMNADGGSSKNKVIRFIRGGKKNAKQTIEEEEEDESDTK